LENVVLGWLEQDEEFRMKLHIFSVVASLTVAIAVRADEGPKTVKVPFNPFGLSINERTGSAGDSVQIGDGYDKVKKAYGKPTGQVYRGKLEVLVYPRGQVELQDGKVSKIRMQDKRTYHAQLVRKAERLRMEREGDDTVSDETGRARLAEVLADPDFDAKPLAEQINYWRKFKRDFPGVNVDPFYQEALDRLKEDI
jgi:hypothetical protein